MTDLALCEDVSELVGHLLCGELCPEGSVDGRLHTEVQG